MKTLTIKLKELFNLETSQEPILDCYLLEPNAETDPNRKHPSILVLPGGGYAFTSSREAEPIALNYLSMGFNAFVLHYSISPERYPEALLETSASIALIRQKSDEWFVDVDKIAVIGFSAGGHLAASISNLWSDNIIIEKLGIKNGSDKPNASILAYPVITSSFHGHKGSFVNLLGNNASEEDLKKLSLETRVSEKTPPTFLWHTSNDSCVPVMNSLLYAEALSEKGIPFELHIFPEGVHGLANCNITTAGSPQNHWQINPHCERWVELSKKWLTESMGF